MSKSHTPSTTSTTAKSVLKVGLDLGTNSSVFQVSKNGQSVKYDNDVFLTLVGYSKPGIIPGILPTDATTLFGDKALEYRLHLDLNWPLKSGFIEDLDSAQDFALFLRDQIDPDGFNELWGVVGAPANSTPERQKMIRRAFNGVFERVLVVPEPFLAAMGLRDEDKVKNDPKYVDPTKHSLIIDIGAGTTDCCLVQGYFPGPDDQMSINVAGDAVDENLASLVAKRFPDIELTRVTVTKLKEAHSYVGPKRSVKVKVYVGGKPCEIDFGQMLKDACEGLVDPVIDCVKQLFAHCDSEGVLQVMKNIIVAGGGSQISGFGEMIQSRLHKEGYEDAKVTTPGDYRHLVAQGAMKIANNVRDDQWQVPL